MFAFLTEVSNPALLCAIPYSRVYIFSVFGILMIILSVGIFFFRKKMKFNLYIILQIFFVIISLLYTYRVEQRWSTGREKDPCHPTSIEFSIFPDPIPLHYTDLTEK